MVITTTRGDLDDSLLRRRDGVIDNENEHTTWTEYCPADCDGDAHRTGQADAVEFFCSKHIHRSAHVTFKKGIGTLAEMQGFQ